MVATCASEISEEYDRASELKAFDESKAGVKGIVDAGVSKVPRMFIQPPDNLRTCSPQFNFPVIDLHGMDRDPIRRKEIVEMVREASKTWGFFTVVNHGIPESVLEEMMDGTRRFYEQDIEVKKKCYSRDLSRKVMYNSNLNLYISKAANWRDTFYCLMSPQPLNPQELPATCRYVIIIHHHSCIFCYEYYGIVEWFCSFNCFLWGLVVCFIIMLFSKTRNNDDRRLFREAILHSISIFSNILQNQQHSGEAVWCKDLKFLTVV